MPYLGSLLVIAGILLQLVAGWKMKPRLKQTSLTGTWWIWLFAWTCWGVSWLCTSPLTTLSTGTGDQLWYATTVITLAVPIAVLGARRPGHVVWVMFVLIPLILVLCWPAWLDLPRTSKGSRLSLEEPTVLGVGLVAVMGFGNYVGTRWTLAVLLALASIVGVMLPISIWGNALQSHSQAFRVAATLANSLAAAFVLVRLHTMERGSMNGKSQSHLATNRSDVYNPTALDQRIEGFNRLWFTFRDLYGLVWARRYQERINHIADREKWPMRLEWFGWVSVRDHASASTQRLTERPEVITPNTITEMEQQQRWLLTRFVQPEWIDRQLS
ncbi:MAG: hypothetical protein O2955_07560 [Planctomycetota bacterium]|nr:hypothetical protein [Planctomycetota bacterium]MDA1212356.1 hypothetical protein [Planctomycetota bacterium]